MSNNFCTNCNHNLVEHVYDTEMKSWPCLIDDCACQMPKIDWSTYVPTQTPKPRKPQCKDIPDQHIINAIIHIRVRDGYVPMRSIQEFFDEFPEKVVQAKLRKMDGRTYGNLRVEGCACGCGTGWVIWDGYKIIGLDFKP